MAKLSSKLQCINEQHTKGISSEINKIKFALHLKSKCMRTEIRGTFEYRSIIQSRSQHSFSNTERKEIYALGVRIISASRCNVSHFVLSQFSVGIVVVASLIWILNFLPKFKVH